jgi:hypothetical protein
MPTRHLSSRLFKEIYNISAEKVNIVNQHPKKKRVGKYQGMTKAVKKAIVTCQRASPLISSIMERRSNSLNIGGIRYLRTNCERKIKENGNHKI